MKLKRRDLGRPGNKLYQYELSLDDKMYYVFYNETDLEADENSDKIIAQKN